MTIELRRHDQVRETWPDADVIAAFREFWDSCLGPSRDPESRWYGWSLLIPGRQPVHLREGDVSRAEMLALVERTREPGFTGRMAQLHAQAPDSGRLDAAPFLLIEPFLPVLEDRLQVLRTALSVPAALRHLGQIGAALPRPPDATFTITTWCGSSANGVGTMTDVAEWCIDVHAPLRVQVLITAIDEQGTPTDWRIAVRHEPQTRVDALLDAFRSHDPYVTDEPGSLSPE